VTDKRRTTLGLLQDWLDFRVMGHFIAVVLHLVWTNIVGLLFVNLYFYIFNRQWFEADKQQISALKTLPVSGHYSTTHKQILDNI